MAVYLSPVGLSAAQVPNRVSLLATYKERLCRRICENSTNQPEAFVTYKTGTPIFNGTTVFCACYCYCNNSNARMWLSSNNSGYC